MIYNVIMRKDEEKILEELNEEHPIEEMLKFDEFSLQDEIKTNMSQAVHYYDLYQKEFVQLDHLKDLLEKLKGKRYKYYRFETDEEWQKPEIEKYCLPSDPKILRMKKLIRKQEIRVRFFEMCYKAFEKREWSIKNYLETLKRG